MIFMGSKKSFPDEKIIVTGRFDVHQDWEVPIPAFFIIASIRKIRSIEEFTKEEAEEFIRLIAKVRKGMREVLGINDVYLFQNEDTKHYFHLWMFPRYKWMEKFGRKIESVRPIINYSKENMTNDKVVSQVKKAVKQMKEYMNEFS